MPNQEQSIFQKIISNAPVWGATTFLINLILIGVNTFIVPQAYQSFGQGIVAAINTLNVAIVSAALGTQVVQNKLLQQAEAEAELKAQAFQTELLTLKSKLFDKVNEHGRVESAENQPGAWSKIRKVQP